MSKYINAKTLIEMLKAKADMALGTPKAVFGNAIKMIDLLPPADVVEVKHGFWEQGDYYDMGDVCSKCQYDSCQQPCHYRYCPNCGAKMDGGRKEDNE